MGGLDSYYYVAYFPVLVVLAVIFTSLRFIVVVTSLTILAYVLTAMFTGDGIQTGLAEDKELYVRVVFLLPVVVAVNAVARYERSGRRGALERERALLNDRLELSQTGTSSSESPSAAAVVATHHVEPTASFSCS